MKLGRVSRNPGASVKFSTEILQQNIPPFLEKAGARTSSSKKLARRLLSSSTAAQKITISNMGKRWSTAEAALACRAYCSATNDSINGADQKIEDFNKKLLEPSLLKILNPLVLTIFAVK